MVCSSQSKTVLHTKLNYSLIIKHLSLVLFSKKNVDKRIDGRINLHTDKRTDGQIETDGQTNRHNQSISKNCVTSLPKRHKKKMSERYMSILE